MKNFLAKFGQPSFIVLPVIWIAWKSASGAEELTLWIFGFMYLYYLVIFVLICMALWSVFGVLHWSERGELIADNLNTEVVNRRRANLEYLTIYCILATASIVLLHWPLRTAVGIWKTPLNQLYDRVERGEKIQTPLRIGTFLIQRAEIVEGGYPALIVGYDPGGSTSLVRAEREPGNKWSYIHLQDNWMLFSED